jgi:HD-GYP domain-containing protein (c-di-GMP phosphodiesterase class II)
VRPREGEPPTLSLVPISGGPQELALPPRMEKPMRLAPGMEEPSARIAEGTIDASPGDVEAILKIAEIVDIRDTGSTLHSQVVADYAVAIGEALGLGTGVLKQLSLAGRAHDIGKVVIPDSVLRKPDRLSGDEWARMQLHPQVGQLVLEGANIGDVGTWVASHHERPDGLGYPHGLTAVEIPLGANILAVADAFEAMTSERPYRAALSRGEAIEELRRSAGAQFDELVVRVLIDLLANDTL